MRGTRWLLLIAILAILGGVGATYRFQKRFLQEQAPKKPHALPVELNSAAEDWTFTQTAGDRAVVHIRARNFKQVKDSGVTELEGVELRIFQKDGNSYDRIQSAHAEFSAANHRLYSDGTVAITLHVPVEGQPKHTLVSIQSSGVTFDSTNGKAWTDRPATFTFENGSGKAVGASYDPIARELHMNGQVELDWKAPGPHSKPMKLEAGQLIYHETGSNIWLLPWARLTRENSVIEAGNTIVTLENGTIRQVFAQKGHGTDSYPTRKLQYSADGLLVTFSDGEEVQKVSGTSHARLVFLSPGADTTATADRIDLNFTDGDGGSVLTNAFAYGNGVVVSKPLPVSGRKLPETRELRSQIIEVKMRPGGQEVNEVLTHADGTLEFLPNRSSQHHRTLKAERMWITYGARNQIQSFRAAKVTTQTDPTAEERSRRGIASTTRSKNLLAQFDPETGQMTRMEEWDDFLYQEGDRKAKADRAVLDASKNLITLNQSARLWNATGSTFADHIQLDQKTGNFIAEGHVNSSRLPDKGQKRGSEILSGDQPLQAIAEKMTSSDGNRLIHYEGHVVLWQEANRIEADSVDIDREKRKLVADGHVHTQLLDKGSGDNGNGTAARRDGDRAKKPSVPVFTTVTAAHLIYTDENRLADYTGGVILNRPGLQVKSDRLRAFLSERGANSNLEKAYADGHVRIVQTTPDRTRIGTGDHAEYFTANQKIVLRGGEPQLADSLRGNTRGQELTYFANDDRLLVNGVPGHPAVSRIRRK